MIYMGIIHKSFQLPGLLAVSDWICCGGDALAGGKPAVEGGEGTAGGRDMGPYASSPPCMTAACCKPSGQTALPRVH